MGIIPCALKCRYQYDGYCGLESCTTAGENGHICPYFKSPDKIDSLSEASDGGNCDVARC